MLYTLIIYICASSLSKPECTVNTAYDIIPVARSYSAASCGMFGQVIVAQTTLLKPDTYLKVDCLPTAKGKRNGMPN